MSFNMSPPGRSFVSFSSSFLGTGAIALDVVPGSAFCFLKKASGFIVVFLALNLGSASFLDFLTFTTSFDKIAERSSPLPLV